ncbi:hypothetical protein K503DRAFT_773610 [Rhizopogon vinicolor AM-OR11-026]|uniref:Uncharacterized protein n=1 Tax=Rhizopogon vinicolor AM-OR11-026 TaxID=1314800 RepID=A0A1B7MRW3_9AGAM|nr:hypothetical protein K503DRAFT_773610 [Rhizopogon vinicolor AM-OR11-026]
MDNINAACCRRRFKITRDPLQLVLFSEWLEKLEMIANDVSEENLKHIVGVFQWLHRTCSHLVFDYSLLPNISTLCAP